MVWERTSWTPSHLTPAVVNHLSSERTIKIICFELRIWISQSFMLFKGMHLPSVMRTRKWGSPIGLAGCGIWLFFAVIFGIWAENRGGMRELQLRVGAGFHVFMVLGCGIRKGKRAGYGIPIPAWPHKLLFTSPKPTSWHAETNLWWV